MDTENRAFRLERCSNYARKTPRQTIQALRREIGSRGRDPSQGAVRPAKRAVPRPRKAGGGIWGRRRGRVSRKRQPRREQGLRDAEAQEGERGAPQGGRDTEKIPGLFEASPSVRFESVRTGGHGMSVKKACGALGASGGGCYAFPNRPKSSSR